MAEEGGSGAGAAPAAGTVDPWEVKGKVDYKKLIEQVRPSPPPPPPPAPPSAPPCAHPTPPSPAAAARRLGVHLRGGGREDAEG